MKKTISIILVLILCCALFAGCNPYSYDDGSGDAVAPDVEGGGLKEQEQSEDSQETGLINPLTGESVSSNISANRPYCVMINNHPDARPCAGLSKASIVYEAVVEGGITRLMAVFNDIDGVTLGSLRSSRPYYLSIAQAYDAIYVHAGGSDDAYSDIKTLGIDNIDGVRGTRSGEASSYYRDNYRKSLGVNIEHTLFADGSKLVSFAKSVYNTTHGSDFDTTYGLQFSADAASQCKDSYSQFEVYYSSGYSTVFKYDSAKKCYNAFISGKEYIDDVETGDSSDNVSIDFANVIILNIPTKTVDNYGRQAMEMTGSGEGYFCCGGKVVEIKWTRSGRDDSFHYTLTDGTPLSLGIGKTFVSVADLDNTKGVVWNA